MVRDCSERVVSVYVTGVSVIYGKEAAVSGFCQYMRQALALSMVRRLQQEGCVSLWDMRLRCLW